MTDRDRLVGSGHCIQRGVVSEVVFQLTALDTDGRQVVTKAPWWLMPPPRSTTILVLAFLPDHGRAVEVAFVVTGVELNAVSHRILNVYGHRVADAVTLGPVFDVRSQSGVRKDVRDAADRGRVFDTVGEVV